MEQKHMDFDVPYTLWEKIKGGSEKMSDREHSFFLFNGINPTGSDGSLTLQLIQDHIESKCKKPEEVLLKLLARGAELLKNKGILSDTLFYQRVEECKEAVQFRE